MFDVILPESRMARADGPEVGKGSPSVMPVPNRLMLVPVRRGSPVFLKPLDHFASTPQKGDRLWWSRKTKKQGSEKGKKGKVKVLNLNKETVKDLANDEAKGVRGGVLSGLSLVGDRSERSKVRATSTL